jgi:hypothetical protein
MSYVVVCATCKQLGGAHHFVDHARAAARRHESVRRVRVFGKTRKFDPAHQTRIARIEEER